MKVGMGKNDSEIHKAQITEGSDPVQYRTPCGAVLEQSLVTDGVESNLTCTKCKNTKPVTDIWRGSW